MSWSLSYEEQFGPSSSQGWSRHEICFTDTFAWTSLVDCKNLNYFSVLLNECILRKNLIYGFS